MDSGKDGVMTDWNEEDLARIRVLFAEKATASDAANVMGRTRNAIIGKWHRMGLSKPQFKAVNPKAAKPKRSQVGRPPGQPTMSRRVVRKAFAGNQFIIVDLKKQNEDAFKPFSDDHVSLMGLKPHHCRWPLDDEGGIVFCGKNRFGLGSYCRKHTQISCQQC